MREVFHLHSITLTRHVLIAGCWGEQLNGRTFGDDTENMRIGLEYIIILLLVLLKQGNALGIVLPNADSSFSVGDSYNERFELMTDRSMYAVGEKIYFKAFNVSPQKLKTTCWSKVLYVQLFHQDGSSVVDGKFSMSCSGSHGYIEIPENLLTGNYYLAAYTKWMRNFSPLHFSYRVIKIINPFTMQLDLPTKPDSLQMKNEISRKIPDIEENIVLCETNKSSYLPGEQVICSIQLPETLSPETYRLTAVACRPGAMDTLPDATTIFGSTIEDGNVQVRFLPEIRGLSLSGKIVVKDSIKPVENARVELSVMGEYPRFFVFFTKEDGRFYFVLDSITGDQEFFIATRHPQYPDLDILIDKDFADTPSEIFNKSFKLSASERELAREIMINMQAEKLYKSPAPMDLVKVDTGAGRSSFYDIPMTPLLIDDYIELPNLKEVFIELVPEVSPKSRRKVPYLYFSGNFLTSQLIGNYEPLILLDQLPVYDLEKLFSISPKRIHSIEVLNEIYALGNTLYGGVINIISKKGDLAGIDLPENSYFFSFSGFSPLNLPPVPANLNEKTDAPDYRNCLLWEPDICLDPGQVKTLKFNTSDRSGPYMILIRGYSDSGEFFQGSTYFEVE
ncbi:hypothetical protein ACFLSP_01270 [Bacteroidota bacterium]